MRRDVPIGAKPEWREVPLRRLFVRVQRPPRPEDGIITAFRDGRVTLRSNRRTEGFTNAVQEFGYQGIRQGDLVVHSMDGFAGAIGVSDSDGKASPVVHAYRPRTGVDARYFAYLLRDLAARGFISALAKGIRERSTAFDSETFRSLVAPVPSPVEQQAIADYLDAEIARIGTLIAKKRQLEEMTAERFESWRESLLLESATGQWVPLHHLTDPYRPIVYGIVQAGPEVPGGVPYIKTGDMADLRPERLSRTSPAIDEAYRRARVTPGDIVIAMRASIGLPARVPPGLPVANLTQGTARIAACRNVDPGWLFQAIQMHVVQEQCRTRAVGTTFKTLNIWDLRRVAVPTPPAAVQPALAARVDLEEARVTRLRNLLHEQIDRLAEHRQALITAAVTGELDIPGVAA